MDIVHIVLRLLHIVSGFIWAGLAFSFVVVISRAAIAAGDKSLPMMKAILTKTPFSALISGAAGVTVIAGLLLYFVADSASMFSRTGNMILGMGSLFGILAAAHGGMALTKYTKQFSVALEQYVSDNGDVASEGRSIVDTLQKKLYTNARITLILTLLGLVFMGTARYL